MLSKTLHDMLKKKNTNLTSTQLDSRDLWLRAAGCGGGCCSCLFSRRRSCPFDSSLPAAHLQPRLTHPT